MTFYKHVSNTHEALFYTCQTCMFTKKIIVFFLAQVTSNTQIPDNFILSVILKFLKKNLKLMEGTNVKIPYKSLSRFSPREFGQYPAPFWAS